MFTKARTIIVGLAFVVAMGALLIPTRAPSQIGRVGPLTRWSPWKGSVDPEIKKVLDAQVAAWNKGDLKGFMAGYWKHPKLSFFSGKDKTEGWDATLERYQKRYQAEGREMGQLTFSELEIEALGPDAALVRGRWKVVNSKETLSGLFTLIFKRVSDPFKPTPEGWRIVHDHTSS